MIHNHESHLITARPTDGNHFFIRPTAKKWKQFNSYLLLSIRKSSIFIWPFQLSIDDYLNPDKDVRDRPIFVSFWFFIFHRISNCNSFGNVRLFHLNSASIWRSFSVILNTFLRVAYCHLFRVKWTNPQQFHSFFLCFCLFACLIWLSHFQCISALTKEKSEKNRRL